MSNPSQPHIIIDPDNDRFEFGYSEEERRTVAQNISKRSIRPAFEFALLVTPCWYVVWFALSINVSAWAGLAVFGIGCVLGNGLARLLWHRRAAEELRRRGELLRVMHYRKQRRSTQ